MKMKLFHFVVKAFNKFIFCSQVAIPFMKIIPI